MGNAAILGDAKYEDLETLGRGLSFQRHRGQTAEDKGHHERGQNRGFKALNVGHVKLLLSDVSHKKGGQVIVIMANSTSHRKRGLVVLRETRNPDRGDGVCGPKE